jgi:hypothetical protein
VIYSGFIWPVVEVRILNFLDQAFIVLILRLPSVFVSSIDAVVPV